MSSQTLMLPEPAVTGQALLFSTEIERRIEEEETRGIYTAERALAKRPGLKEAVIALRAAGEGYLSIAAKLNCHHRTVTAIATMFSENVDIERAKRVSRLRSAADKLVELIDNEPNSVPPAMRALASSQLYDKAELLDGRATQRIEHTERVDIFATWDATVEKLLDPASVVEIEAAPAGIGLGGGNDSIIGAHGEAGPPAELASDRAGSDEESLVSSITTKVEEPTDTTTGTDRAADPSRSDLDVVPRPGAQAQGGEGVAPAEGGAIAPIDSKTRNFSGNTPRPLPPATLI